MSRHKNKAVLNRWTKWTAVKSLEVYEKIAYMEKYAKYTLLKAMLSLRKTRSVKKVVLAGWEKYPP